MPQNYKKKKKTKLSDEQWEVKAERSRNAELKSVEITRIKREIDAYTLKYFISTMLIIGISFALLLQNISNNYIAPEDRVDIDEPTDPPNPFYHLNFRVSNIDGQSFSMGVYQGKTLIVYFTGASCIPCKQQLPFIINSYNTFKGTGKVEVISFDIQGTSITALKTWRTTNQITWQVCQDNGLTLSSHFSVVSMPTLIICDETGIEITRYVGAQSESTINNIFLDAIS